MTMPNMHTHSVILDANILIRDYKLIGNEIRKLIKTKDLYSFRLCIPEVVYDECIGNYAKESRVRIEKLMRSIDDINEMISSSEQIKKETIEKKLKQCVSKYKKRLLELVNKNNITLLQYPMISHKDVVNKIYEKNQPFNNEKVSEKGYKDFLIVESIRRYLQDNALDGKTIILTKNEKDFIENNSDKEKHSIIPIATTFNLNTVYVASSSAILFEDLKLNLENKDTSKNIIKDKKLLSELIRAAIIKDYQSISADMFGVNIFDIVLDQFKCNVVDFTINFDEELDILEVSGIIDLFAYCSFSIDNYDVKYFDKDFPFTNKVIERVNSKSLSLKDDWTEEFNKIEYKNEFMFNYIDFEYSKNNFHKEIDPSFLSISKI